VLSDSLPFIDFLFGNEAEAAAFAESEGWETRDLAEIALKVGGRRSGEGSAWSGQRGAEVKVSRLWGLTC
jgi:hypothetical protein